MIEKNKIHEMIDGGFEDKLKIMIKLEDLRFTVKQRETRAKKEFLSDLLSKVENKWFTADCIPDDAVVLESWFNKWIKELEKEHLGK